MGKLFTIGYANKDIKEFVALLQKNGVDCVVDVRTTPYSKQYPQYNEDAIRSTLHESGLTYMSFKAEFGARRAEDDVYEEVVYPDGTHNEVVIFQKVWKTEQFQKGVKRVLNGLAKGLHICFMCSEKYPYECHRTCMVSEYFYRVENIEPNHIFDIDTTVRHTCYDETIERIFQEQKSKFLNRNHMELAYGGGLLAEAFTVSEYILAWDRFFAVYTREKGYYLQNLLIGYKKGVTENE